MTSQGEKKAPVVESKKALVAAKGPSVKTGRTWVWVLLIVLFAILVTGGVCAYVLTREISVAVENKIEMPVTANILNTTKPNTTKKTAPKSTNAPAKTPATKPANTLDNGLLDQ